MCPSLLQSAPLPCGRHARESFPLVTAFLSKVRYGDVYDHAESKGDGNKFGSASDIETRATLEEIQSLLSVLRGGRPGA